MDTTIGLANILPNAPLPDARTQEDAYYATHTIDLSPPRWLKLLLARLQTSRRTPVPVPLALARMS